MGKVGQQGAKNMLGIVVQEGGRDMDAFALKAKNGTDRLTLGQSSHL